MTFDFVVGLILGATIGAVVAGFTAWRVLIHRAVIRPPKGKLGDRVGRNAVPDDRYPLW